MTKKEKFTPFARRPLGRVLTLRVQGAYPQAGESKKEWTDRVKSLKLSTATKKFILTDGSKRFPQLFNGEGWK